MTSFFGYFRRSPPLSDLVGRLARARRIESERVNEGGEPSPVHALFRQVAWQATREQALDLLRHPSPVVRGYLARHVLAAFPDDLAAAYPLLSDAAAVETQDGCCGGRTTVAEVVLEALEEHLDRPEVGRLLLRAALDEGLGDLRGEAAQTLASRHPDEAAAAARALLREPGEKVVAAAVWALTTAGDQESVAEVAGLAASPHDRVRAAVAAFLDRAGGPRAEPTLRQLTADADPYVRMLAGAGYVRQPGRDLSVVRRLLNDPAPRVSSHVAAALGKSASEEDLSLLREYLAAHPNDWKAIAEAPQDGRAGVVALMRDVLADERSQWLWVRAIGHLHSAQDRACLPMIRRALRSDCVSDRQAAAEALAGLGDVDSVPDLVALLADANPHGRLAAARALVRLRADVREALDRAAAADASWAKEELLALAGQLRSTGGA